MKTLQEYVFKYVNVVDADDISYNNYYVDDFTSAADNDDRNEESIGLLPYKGAKTGIELYESEIKSIESVYESSVNL